MDLELPKCKENGSVSVNHENVLAWALKDNLGPLGTLLNNRLEGKNRDLTFLEHFYRRHLI